MGGEFCLRNQHRLIKDEYQMQFETNIFVSRWSVATKPRNY